MEMNKLIDEDILGYTIFLNF